jgi:hypothetical protein
MKSMVGRASAPTGGAQGAPYTKFFKAGNRKE